MLVPTMKSPLLTSSPSPETSFQHAREILWSFGYLNLTVLWAYQTLLSAQNYYQTYFPDAHLDFLGTVAAGTSMFLAHIFQLYFRVYEKAAFRTRLFTGYIGYALVGIIVVIPQFRSVGTIVFGFAAVGALNTLTESPLYGLAGLFPPVFTQALQIGNGLAGFLNVLVDAGIRGVIDWSKSSLDHDAFSYELFVGIMIAMSIGAIALFYRMEHLPPVAARLQELEDQQLANSAQAKKRNVGLRSAPSIMQQGATSSEQYENIPVYQESDVGVMSPSTNERYHSSGGVYQEASTVLVSPGSQVPIVSSLGLHEEIPLFTIMSDLRYLVFAQFYVLFISLLLWPGIPCGITLTGWFAENPSWWCSPLIIATFNTGDLIGRSAANVQWLSRRLDDTSLVGWTLARTLFVLLIPFRHNVNNVVALLLVVLLGLSNGLLCTVSMMHGAARQKDPAARERAAYVLTAALYLGIGLGSIVAATLDLLKVLD
jgi:hypothetical protein